MAQFNMRSGAEPLGDVGTAEITNVSVEISPKIMIAGEMPKDKQYDNSGDQQQKSPSSEEEMAGQSAQMPNQSPAKTKMQRKKFKNNDGRQNLQIDTSGLDGLMNSQKIQAYEAML